MRLETIIGMEIAIENGELQIHFANETIKGTSNDHLL